MGRHKQQTEEAVGTLGRWRVGANPSVRREEETQSPKGQELEWSHPGLHRTAVQVGLRPQRAPNPGTGWDETCRMNPDGLELRVGCGTWRWGD